MAHCGPGEPIFVAVWGMEPQYRAAVQVPRQVEAQLGVKPVHQPDTWPLSKQMAHCGPGDAEGFWAIIALLTEARQEPLLEVAPRGVK